MTPHLTAIIAEDEVAQRRELRALLADLWPELDVVAECADGLAALEAMQDLQPTLAFLDIRMPGLSGIDVAKAAGRHTHIVLVTAYDEFAVAAFEAGAADYLLKPVRRERLATTIQRLRRRLEAGQTPAPVDLIAALQARLQPEKRWLSWISASVGDVIRMIAVDEVLAFRSEDKYTSVLTATGSAYIRTPLKELIVQLDPEVFWQVHRSAIVRVAAIRTVRRDEDGKLRISLAGSPETLPVSTVFNDRFRPM
jgi:DNA-binding LytR/AlgR family response regulator